MKKLFNGIDNILFDESSGIKPEDLCEKKFLKEVLTLLSQIMKDEFNDYLFFLLSSANPSIIPSSAAYITDKNKILIFISEEEGKSPEYLSPHYYAIFKSYIQTNQSRFDNIFHFPLGSVENVPHFSNIPVKSRKYSVFFIGNLNNSRMKFYFYLLSTYFPFRLPYLKFFSRIKKVFLIIKSKFDNRFENAYIRFTNGFRQGISPLEYGKIIANSKIVLCPKGDKSPECFRHYEAMRAGCIIFSEKLPNTPFYEGSPIIQIDNWKEGFRKIDTVLKNEIELENLSDKTQEWWKNKCSEIATAKYMFSSILEVHNEKL